MSANTGEKRRQRPTTCIERLGIWDKIQVRYMKDESNDSFEVRVEDFSERMLYVSFPDAQQKLRYGERVEATFTRDQGLFKFDGILDTGVHAGRQYLTIRVLGGARHIQRRTAVRVPLRLKMEVAVITRLISKPIDLKKLVWDETVSDNFSFSGALIKTVPSCLVGDVLVLKVNREQLPVAPKYMLASWRRLQRMGDLTFMGVEFITRRGMKSFLLPEEIDLIPEEFKKLSEITLNSFSKYVFEYELKMRQEGRM